MSPELRSSPARRRVVRRAGILRYGLALALAVGVLAMTPPAHGAGDPGANLGDLQTELAGCSATLPTPYGVMLTADLSDPAAELVVNCDARIDLAGHDLSVGNLIVSAGTSLEVTDSTPVAAGPDPNADAGTLTADATGLVDIAGIQNTGATLTTTGTAQVRATGGPFGAGIGGGNQGAGGTTTSSDTSTITATGGPYAAGIGGGAIGAGGTTTSNDTSTITATAGTNGGAGIGGGYQGVGGTTTSNDTSTITATGGANGGAGIGGGYQRDGGTTTSNDTSTITATGGSFGAGIGGGWAGAGDSTTSNDTSTITATGGTRGAGIGGGYGGAGGTTTIDDTSAVVAAGAGGGSAVGVGYQASPAAGTFLHVDGTLLLGSDLLVPDATGSPEVTVASTGVIARRTSPASTAAITGTGTLANAGAITLPTTAVDPTLVTDRHYRVTFDTQGGSAAPDDVTVYADTFTHGDRTFPPDPTKPGLQFLGWNTAADGTGTTIGADTPLPGASADGTATTVALHAQYADPAADLTGLRAALAHCSNTLPAPYLVALTADLSDPAAELVVNCDARIDLAGHDLSVRNVIVSTGTSLEVTDSTAVAAGPDPNTDAGTLTADAAGHSGIAGIQNTGAILTTTGTAQVKAIGGPLSAGIGGGAFNAGGTTTSNDTSTITATGGAQAAGIGGGGIGAGGTTTSNDASAITATGGLDGAGVGGGTNGNGGTTTSNDTSTITATGGSYGAGIGGGLLGVGDATTSNDTSTITATGGSYGAGIGGGYQGAGGTTTSNDTSTVTATGGFRGAGVGGGYQGAGGTTTIDDTSAVVATGGSGGSAVGLGYQASPAAGTFLHVDGTLRLGSDLLVPDATGGPEVTVTATGLIARRPSSASTATITGTGTVDNAGAITLPTAAVDPTLVTDHHYRVTFDTQGGSAAPDDVTVYADTFTHGDRTFPPAPFKPGFDFTGWNTAADGTGTTIGPDTPLPGASADGTATTVALHAQYLPEAPPLAVTGLDPTISGVAQVGQVLQASPGPVRPAAATLAHSWAADGRTIMGTDGPALTLTPDLEGARITVTITATAPSHRSETRTSAPTTPVQPADPGPDPDPDPVAPVSPPEVTGSRHYDAVLTVTAGTWTGDPTTITFQWLRDGTPVPGADTTDYRTTLDDIGHLLSVRVTASQSPTNTADVTVTAGKIRRAPMSWNSSKRLTTTGRAEPGHRLRSSIGKAALLHGTDPDATTVRYRWLRDGTPVANSDHPSYRLRRRDAGHRLVLTVTLARPGHRPVVLRTKPVHVPR